MKLLLLFHMALQKSSQLLTGRIDLIDTENNKIINRFIATSGCPGWQSYENISSKGKGPIPPQYETGVNQYWADTKPLWLPGVKGVEGRR
jgi:hypothetical protein